MYIFQICIFLFIYKIFSSQMIFFTNKQRNIDVMRRFTSLPLPVYLGHLTKNNDITDTEPCADQIAN